jgi:uncharacterized damage-inducible protein DinB
MTPGKCGPYALALLNISGRGASGTGPSMLGMMNDTALDTTIREPSMTAGEVELLLFTLDRSRATFAWKIGGLDAASLNRPHPPSTMTLGGLLKHLALVEERYTIDFTGEAPGPPLDVADHSDPDWAWRTAADDSPEDLYDLWRRTVERSRTAMARALADGGLDQPAKYTTSEAGTSPNLRRIVVDLQDEYARHVGHADLMREVIDGLVGDCPPQ